MFVYLYQMSLQFVSPTLNTSPFIHLSGYNSPADKQKTLIFNNNMFLPLVLCMCVVWQTLSSIYSAHYTLSFTQTLSAAIQAADPTFLFLYFWQKLLVLQLLWIINITVSSSLATQLTFLVTLGAQLLLLPVKSL